LLKHISPNDVDTFLSGTSQKTLFESEMWLCHTVRTTTDILWWEQFSGRELFWSNCGRPDPRI